MYPLEIQLAQTLAAGKPIAGVTWDVVNELNGRHATENTAVTAGVSLNADAPLTCQFFLEDHAVRHSYHHLARIRAALAPSAA
jgi:hypothetical protein